VGETDEGITWIKSSYCNSTSCVEVARREDHVLLRDAKDLDGPILTFTLSEWSGFLAAVRQGDFDLP